MDKNEREKQLLYEWGTENNKQNVFQIIEKERESYYIQRVDENNPNSYITEYKFETLPELTKELNTLWKDNEVLTKVMKIIGVAALKNKPSRTIQEKKQVEDRTDTGDKLPAFIYNF